MESKDFEKFKIMYDVNYDELNRSRDWPIKILAFTSAAYLAIYGLLKFDSPHTSLCRTEKWILTVVVIILTFIVILNILNQHNQYKKYRNNQRRLQLLMGIDSWEVNNELIFPREWSKPIKENQKSCKFNLAGWPFYVMYVIVLASIALVLIFRN